MKGDRGKEAKSALALVWTAVGAAGFVVVLYAVSPYAATDATTTVVGLVVALAALGVLVVLRVRRIRRHHDPRGQAIEAVALVIPLFVAAFAWAYTSLSRIDPGAFSQPVTRVDGVYFCLVVLSTVGFGDISPVSELARMMVSAQIVLQITLLVLVLRVIAGTARARHDEQAFAAKGDNP